MKTWRLDDLLRRKADEGVRVYVLMYKELEMTLAINSYYSKQTLQGMHSKNIKVSMKFISIELCRYHYMSLQELRVALKFKCTISFYHYLRPFFKQAPFCFVF